MAKFEKVEGKVVKKRRKWRFSEIVILVILFYAVVVFNLALYFAFSRNTDSIFWYLLPSIGTLASSAFGMFVWKEKNENLPKIKANPDYDNEQTMNEIEYDMQQEFQNLDKKNYF